MCRIMGLILMMTIILLKHFGVLVEAPSAVIRNKKVSSIYQLCSLVDGFFTTGCVIQYIYVCVCCFTFSKMHFISIWHPNIKSSINFTLNLWKKKLYVNNVWNVNYVCISFDYTVIY